MEKKYYNGKKYHTVGLVLKSNRQMIETDNIDTMIHIWYMSVQFPGTDISIKSGGLDQYELHICKLPQTMV